jgi:polyhydroxyalkanoate synthesis regulator phasin
MKVISKMIFSIRMNKNNLENKIDNSMLHMKDDLFLLDNKYEILSAKVDTMYDKINDIETCFDTTISDYNKYFENFTDTIIY